MGMHVPLCLWRSGTICTVLGSRDQTGLAASSFTHSNLAGLNWGFSKISSYLLESKIITTSTFRKTSDENTLICSHNFY